MKPAAIITSLISLLAAGSMPAAAQLTAAGAFADAPASVFPLVERSARLDMIDYFNHGMDTPTPNVYSGQARITSLTPERLTMEMTEASSYEIDLLPAASDTLIAVISTVASPQPDSRIAVYSRDWKNNLTTTTFSRPTLESWLTDAGKKSRGEVEALVPFLLISYAYDPANRTLTLTNNTKAFLSADVYEIVAPYLKPALTYSWTGKRFEGGK